MLKSVKLHENGMKHYMRLNKMHIKTHKRPLKTQNNPGSSHPYTQRQLGLERKLKSTCPQVRQNTPQVMPEQDPQLKTTQGVMHFKLTQRITGP